MKIIAGVLIFLLPLITSCENPNGYDYRCNDGVKEHRQKYHPLDAWKPLNIACTPESK